MRVLVVALVVLAAAPAAARADMIVFRRGTDIWRMAPDGSGQVRLTGGERRYEWPSAADDGTPTHVVLRLFAAAAVRATPAFRCELGLEAADTYASASPSFSPGGRRIAWAESDGIHIATLRALDDCGAIREQVVTLPDAWEPYWSRAPEPLPGTKPTTLTLSVATRAHPHRLTLRKRGLRVRVTVSAPTTVQLSLRARGLKRTVTRKLANAGTTTIRLRLPKKIARSARRLVLAVSAPGAARVTATIRPRT
jgi:hypothetical protein